MKKYNLVMESKKSTVVTEYEPTKRTSDSYQSEAQLEKDFIKDLQNQGYEYLNIKSSLDLEKNLRKCLEELNDYSFSDSEWDKFFNFSIANSNDGIVEKTRMIQEDNIQVLKKDDGLSKNITLIDKKNVYKNKLQVINQYVPEGGKYENRYDVTILVNGFPMVHVELKRRSVAIKEAFNQIERYQRESFWADSGLFEYVQIFVISNGTNTKYYSNTTRFNSVKENSGNVRNSKKTSNSFEFTSFWANSKNEPITDLVDFTKTFFAQHTILNILTKYCVFTAENMLLVMRPYQIAATEKIINKIDIAYSYKRAGSIKAGGYIWHTTGSGKTLTSFKTAKLATKLDYIDKVLFVVDRKDLDYQTMKEYDRFQKGAANTNRSTRILAEQLADDNAKIIITTIQKLSEFTKRNKNHPIYQKHVVMIFDECHRSQFGLMHDLITASFKKYYLFGFTGTPIFANNAVGRTDNNVFTTEQVFGDKLHTYTIVNAINDGNVLPFRIDYINTIKSKESSIDQKVSSIDTEETLAYGRRVSQIVSYILKHFDQKTKRNSFYDLKGKRVNGFNSILAVASIPMARKYYLEFENQIKNSNSDLVIGTIFSFSPNEDMEEITQGLGDESFDTSLLDVSSREFLDYVIDKHNNKFGTNYSSEGESFQNYYKDISDRMKKREIDILIVVNMFLTGFDATTLNTLWVDKNLKYHGLIQAFSRTNRILNSVKSYGNIVCFRNLEKETNEALSLFGNENARGVVLLKPFEDYFYGYEDEKGKYHKGYEEMLEEIYENFPINENIIGEERQKKFINLMNAMFKIRNILSSFDKFDEKNKMPERDFQDYTGKYLDIKDSIKPKETGDAVSILDDVVFEMEFIKQIEVNIDYILSLVAKYYESNCQDKELIVNIDKAINSSVKLRSKKELIDGFIERINAGKDGIDDWTKYVIAEKEKDIKKIIDDENLKEEETKKFIDNSFRDGEIKTYGTDIEKIMPAISFFSPNKEDRSSIKEKIIVKLKKFFEKYFGLGIFK